MAAETTSLQANELRGAWAVLLPSASALSAGSLRLRGDVQATQSGDDLWLRGPELSEELDLELRKLPGGRRFRVAADGRLTAVGARIPQGRLPDAGWQPLSDWLAPRPQPAALAGQAARRVGIRLVRADGEVPVAVLVTRADAWAAYATTAPAVRLRPLRVAAAEDGRVVLWGAPLPPIPGERYAERDGIAVPAGLMWSPPVDAAVLRDLLELQPGDLALFDADGSYEHVAAAEFTRASRSGARATADPAVIAEPAQEDEHHPPSPGGRGSKSFPNLHGLT